MSKQMLDSLIELANHYPSPHNGQPIRTQQTSSDSFEMYFDKNRGLQATDISYIFSFVSMGVFMQHLVYSAEALGHSIRYELDLPKEHGLRGEGNVKFGKCTIQWNTHPPDNSLKDTLLFRQTSRKKYSDGVSSPTKDKIVRLANEKRMTLKQLNSKQARQTIWLNQRAVFDDMFDEPVRQELDHWLRYDKGQKFSKRDGLAYDCMEINGQVMKFTVDHPGILRLPILSALIRQYYLRTMMDKSDVYYMLAPFASEQDSFNVGLVVMQVWKTIAAEGSYIHPFGTIMSNKAAHKDFIELVTETTESLGKSYLVFIFRCGKSVAPVRSLRISPKQHLMME